MNADFTKKRKIFFGVLLFSQDKEIQKIFGEHGFTTVPYLTVSNMNLKRDQASQDFFNEEQKWLINGQEIFDAQKQIDFLNNHLRTDVQIKYTFASIAIKNAIGATVLAILIYFVKSIYPVLMNQKVWFFVAIAVFVICTGGIVFSILNNMPWFRFEKNEFGAIVIGEYFMRGQRGQYAGEGYIISILATSIGLIYLYLSLLEKRHGESNT